MLDNYVKQALASGVSVSIMVPDISFKHIEHCEYDSQVRLYSFRSQENWGISGFDFDKLISDPLDLDAVFCPDLVHIIDWVNFHPALFGFLRKFGCPIVRSVCNFEEFCPFSYPVFFGYKPEPCAVPLDLGKCLECVSDNVQFTVPSALYTYKVLIRDLAEYKNNYRQGISPLLIRRTEFVRSLFKNYIDYVVFPSANFGQYFLTQLQDSIEYKVIPHGLSEVAVTPLRESTFPIKIVYTGGDRANKGWDIMSDAIELLSRSFHPQFEIHFVGNTESIPEHYFQNSNVKLVRNPPYRRHEEVSFLRSFDIAIAPSHFESYGLFVRECVRSRVVPIVIPSLGVSEFIVNGENGFQLDPPYAENLVHAILRLTGDANALTAFRAGLDVSSVPTAAAEFDELYNLYCELIASH